MNWNNFVNLGSWLQQKLDALYLKKHTASQKIESSGFSHLALSLEWAAMKEDAIERVPSTQEYPSHIFPYPDHPLLNPLGASKTAAAKTASGIIALMDSLQQTDGLIKATMDTSSSSGQSQALLSLSLTLEDLIDLRQKLFKRIQKATRLLLGKDASTAAAVKRAMKNEFLMKRMKAHAIRLKIRQQVRDMLLMSVSIKRRTSREKKGKQVQPFSSDLANICIFP
jgi:hypothetical protein